MRLAAEGNLRRKQEQVSPADRGLDSNDAVLQIALANAQPLRSGVAESNHATGLIPFIAASGSRRNTELLS